MNIAKTKGPLRGRRSNLRAAREDRLVALHPACNNTRDSTELFHVGRSNVYRAWQRQRKRTAVQPEQDLV